MKERSSMVVEPPSRVGREGVTLICCVFCMFACVQCMYVWHRQQHD